MYKKICVTPSEMRTMREEGMSNHDIAKSLDVSYNTVVRYIGKQPGRMERLAGFRDDPVKIEKKAEVTEMATVMPRYNPKPIKEAYVIGEARITLNNDVETMYVEDGAGTAYIKYADIPELAVFLAWAMRERMEAIPDEVRKP